MNKRAVICGAILAFSIPVFCGVTPTSTSDVSVLQSNVRAALRSAKNFVFSVYVKPGADAPKGGVMIYTAVAPNRFRQTTSGMKGGDDDTIIIGNKVYGHDSDAWNVQTWSDHLVKDYESDTYGVTIVSIGADQTFEGKTEGRFVMKYPPDEKDAWLMTCSYDKQTFRPLGCTGSAVSATWRFDDPSIIIPTPADAKPAG